MSKPVPSFLQCLVTAARPLVGAHRGASADHPENTPAAFAAAAAQGADFWELDIRLSADGVPMVIHDAAIDRTTGGHGLVASMTAIALEGYGVPALATVLALGKGRTFFNIELKEAAGGFALAAAAAEAIVALRLERQTIISSFDRSLLVAFRQLCPALPTGLLYEQPLPDPIADARALGADALHPYYRLAGARLVNTARDAGLAVIPWTVDRPLYLRHFATLGVNGIITNRPALAAALLKTPTGNTT